MKAPDEHHSAPLSASGWIALAILLGLFLTSLWYGVKVWTSMAGVQMSEWGWFTLVLGIVFTIALGVGLMALVFYSSRNDYDQ